jgi:transposase
MPWKECSVMDERLRFVAQLLDGEAMSEVCRAFGISRKTGYKIFERYKEHGLEALTDRSRRPVRYANQLPQQIESLIVAAKREKPHWGARKIRERLVRRLDGDIRVPAKSTIHAVLHRHGLVKVPGRPRHRATGTPLSTGAAPNDLWCADFKGEFKLGNGRYCFPLTVTDHASRYLLPTPGDPVRQWRAVRQSECPLQSLQTLGVVAPPRHCHRAHQAWPPAAERPPRTYASHAEERSNPTTRNEQPAATGPFR